MSAPVEAAVSARLDRFCEMIATRDEALLDELWHDGDFAMVGSEQGEICRTRAELAAKLAAIFGNPATFVFDFPSRYIRLAGSVAWIFAEGTLARIDPTGERASRSYLAMCIFENVGGVWRWRQFFGSEPY